MDKIELKFLTDHKYVTDVGYIDYYNDSKNKDKLKSLTKKKVVDEKKFTQAGYLTDYHTFELVPLTGDGSLCKDCTVYINDIPGSIEFVKHGSKVKWKVKVGDRFSNEIEEKPIEKDTIIVITVSAPGDEVIVKKEDNKPVPEELYG